MPIVASPFPVIIEEVIDPRWVKSWASCGVCNAQCGWPALPSTYIWKDFPHNLADMSDPGFERYAVFYNNACDLNSTQG
jgi:hypothetical protein